jgi:hypothetical protein
MAVVTRYYGIAAAGDDDGTTWDNRKAFVVGGAINTQISGFDFTSDSLIVRVGPGTHELTTGIATFTGTAGPSAEFPCIFEGALSDGTRWIHPNRGWMSAQPAWDADDATYPMPVIATTTNIFTLNNAFVLLYGLKLTASGRNGSMINTVRSMDQCQVINSTSNASAACITGHTALISNCHFECSGTAYDFIVRLDSPARNVRSQGNPAATSGNRRGCQATASPQASRITAVGNVGGGILQTTASNRFVQLDRCTVANNEGNGISNVGDTNQTGYIDGCMITGGHTNGISESGAAKAVIRNCRIRGFTSAALSGSLPWNVPPLNGNITDAGTDGDEYVNAAIGDYRIKNTSDYWGKGIGAGDEPASGGGGGAAFQLVGGGGLVY